MIFALANRVGRARFSGVALALIPAVASAYVCWKQVWDCTGTCGSAGFKTCNAPWVQGSPGKRGTIWLQSHVSCYEFAAGETVSAPCNSPPSGFSTSTGCPPDVNGNCCFMSDTSSPLETQTQDGYSIPSGADC